MPTLAEEQQKTKTSSMPAQGTRNVWIEISRSKPNMADNIAINKRQMVEWYTKHNEGFYVEFMSDTPFDTNKYFVAPSNVKTPSSPADGVAGKHYKYVIKNANGDILVDPEIVIRG